MILKSHSAQPPLIAEYLNDKIVTSFIQATDQEMNLSSFQQTLQNPTMNTQTMKRMLLIFPSIAVMALLVNSCNKEKIAKDTPDCIKREIAKIQSEEVRNPPASVWEYQYNGKTVYYIPSYCCDMFSQLFDDHCNLICSPDGGITGGGDGQCTDFFDKRKHEKLVWQDGR